MGTNGVDVSQYQYGTDLTHMSGLDFVIAKASEGHTIQDRSYGMWAQQAQAANAQFGAYHFFHAEALRTRAEADFFCSIARPRSGLSLWVDYETYGVSGQHDAEMLGYFIREVKGNIGNQQKVGFIVMGKDFPGFSLSFMRFRLTDCGTPILIGL